MFVAPAAGRVKQVWAIFNILLSLTFADVFTQSELYVNTIINSHDETMTSPYKNG